MRARVVAVCALGAASLGVASANHGSSAPSQGVLRVCADPNNLPFSNRREEGFENKLATLLGRELGARVEYTWWAQRRGFFRNTINSGLCDLVVGVPTSLEMVRRTRPYYRSTYVFVSRPDRRLRIASLDDPILRGLRIGVSMVGDDYSSTPPAAALIKRGLASRLVPISVYGDYGKPDPPADLIAAVRDGRVDVAIAWGPLAGYFGGAKGGERLTIEPVTPRIDLPFLPMVFDISMGVRREDSTFALRIDSVLSRRRPSIDSLLAAYGVPRVEER